MPPNRIQKLLFSEYNDFEDMVLVESPFAQTTKDGRGIRQVQMGLTPTKLILATDVFEETPLLKPSIDPEINNFELLSVSPVECVNISVFRRRTRNTLKAHFCNNRVLYFELATPERRDVFWNQWCERVKFLCPQEPQSSASETSVGSTTSFSSEIEGSTQMTSTQQILEFIKSGHRQKANIWLPVDGPNATGRKEGQPKKKKRSNRSRDSPSVSSACKMLETGIPVNRFREGVEENCFSALYLPAHFRFAQNGPDRLSSGSSSEESESSILSLIDECVEMWEKNRTGKHHHRRYALVPSPTHLSGYGINQSSPSQASNFKLRGYSSETSVRQHQNPEFTLDVPKPFLTASLSEDNLFSGSLIDRGVRRIWQPTSPILVFWTPQFNYCPMTEKMIYHKKRSLMGRLLKRRKDDAFESPIRTPSPDFLGGGEFSRENLVSTIKRKLKMDVQLSIWDFNSTTFAYQLTMIEKTLFNKVRAEEVALMMTDNSSKRAPNIQGMISFSNRISNLVATEILNVESLKMRARLIARCISITEKLHKLHNFQSTRSVLVGLQTNSIYRLKMTWDYMRHHHSSKYRTLCRLMKLHRDPRTPEYKKFFEWSSSASPYLPSLPYLITALLGHFPHIPTSKKGAPNQPVVVKSTTHFSSELEGVLDDSTIESDNSVPPNAKPDCLIKCLGKHIDLERTIKMEVGSQLLEIWQKASRQYSFVENKTVLDFLMKAHYREENENFEKSLQIEPPLGLVHNKRQKEST